MPIFFNNIIIHPDNSITKKKIGQENVYLPNGLQRELMNKRVGDIKACQDF